MASSVDEVPVAGESVVCFKYALEGDLVEVILLPAEIAIPSPRHSMTALRAEAGDDITSRPASHI
jgi:hypothetical protein